MATYMHKHTYICMYVHAYAHTYIHTYTHNYICYMAEMHGYMHAYIHTYMYAYIHTCMHTYIHIHTPTYIHIYTHIHVYIHTYIQSSAVLVFSNICSYSLHLLYHNTEPMVMPKTNSHALSVGFTEHLRASADISCKPQLPALYMLWNTNCYSINIKIVIPQLIVVTICLVTITHCYCIVDI